METLPTPVRRAVEAELQPGEDVLWAGRPVFPRPLPSLWWAAGLLGVGLAALYYALWAVLPDDGPDRPEGRVVVAGLLTVFVALFTIPMSYFYLGVDYVRRWGAGRTGYVLTDRRAVVIDGGFPELRPLAYVLDRLRLAAPGHEVGYVLAGEFADLLRVDRPDGTGDVLFRSVLHQGAAGLTGDEWGFHSIPAADAERVEDLARSLAAKAGSGAVSGNDLRPGNV